MDNVGVVIGVFGGTSKAQSWVADRNRFVVARTSSNTSAILMASEFSLLLLSPTIALCSSGACLGVPALFAHQHRPTDGFRSKHATSKYEFGLAFISQLLIVQSYDREKAAPAVQVEMA
jgi:hypothetical protein